MTQPMGNGNGNGDGLRPAFRISADADQPSPEQAALHRLQDVRRQEGLSRRTVAQRLGITVRDVKQQEQGATDLPLSVFYQWQQILDVPVADLLMPPTDSLSAPVMKRAQMVQLMKMAATISEQAREVSMRRLARHMVEQLVDIMPELKKVRP